MNAKINTPRILQAMREKGWDINATCANCGVHHKTLSRILKGEFPKRLDAWYRLVNNLGITEEEALLATASHPARVYVLPDRRPGSKEVA